MARVRQKFDPSEITDPAAGIRGELSRPEIAATLKPGMNIAITAGSRGIHNHKLILKTVVDIVKEHGANPFVVPAMGSHGGATAQGQLEVLKGFGITPAYLGCPIKSSMETVRIGVSPEGHDVHIDKNAWEADGIIVINKIKPHTAFRGSYESGLMKMMTIGLGDVYKRQSFISHSLPPFVSENQNTPILVSIAYPAPFVHKNEILPATYQYYASNFPGAQDVICVKRK